MNGLTIMLLIIVIICIIVLFFAIIYNRYQETILRINEVESHIDDTLRLRFDLINRSINVIKANANIDKDIFEEIVKLRSRKLTNFDLDRKLNDALIEFYSIKDTYPCLQESEAYKQICEELQKTDESLIAYRTYYNKAITKYNRLVKIFPFNIIGFIFKYKEKPFYDGKNMSDDIFDDFKL